MIPNWLYISKTAGTSGTTVITVSAGTNDNTFERTEIFNVLSTVGLEKDVIIKQEYNAGGLLTVNPIVIEAPASGGQFDLSITSTTEWTAVYPSWVSGPTSGISGSVTISINVDNNISSGRTSYIVITNSRYAAAVNVIQDAFNEVFTVTPVQIEAHQSGGTYNITVSSNTEWTVSYPSWITGISSGTGTQTFTITVSNNPNYSGRTENIVITARSGDYEYVIVSQNKLIYIISTPSTITVPQAGGNYTISVSANTDWSVSYPSWVSGQLTGSSGNQSITISVDTNNSGNQIIEYMNFTSADLTYSVQGTQITQDYSSASGDSRNLTFEIISGGTILIGLGSWSSDQRRYVEYTKDSGANWTRIWNQNSYSTINVSAGDIISFRGNCYEYYDAQGIHSQTDRVVFGISFSTTSTATFRAYGNPKSLFYTNINNTGNYPLWDMFQYCTGLTDASDLYIPSTFPSTSFNCASMFRYCSNLTTAPNLPATTLNADCYKEMFYYCNKLNYIKCLATDMSATDCTKDWVKNVASSGTFIKASGASWVSGDSGIPNNWTITNN